MEHLTKIVQFVEKRIGLLSNQLLKCVLLNTAIELFSYIDASTYSCLTYQYHDWTMEDFDHLYARLPDTGQLSKFPDVLVTSVPSDGVTEQAGLQQNPSISENTVNSSDQLGPTHLPLSETLIAQTIQELDLLDLETLKSDQDISEMLCLFGPVDILLEFPLFCVEQVTSTENLYQLLAADLQVLPHITVLNCSTTGNGNETINACGVQTDDLIITDIRTLSSSQMDGFFGSFNNEDETEPKSVFWDSYDLHVSRSPHSFQHANMSDVWECKHQDICSIEDALFMGEEVAEECDLDNWLYAELYPVCTMTDETDMCNQVTPNLSEDTRGEPVSSTPCMKKPRSRNLIQS